MGEDLNPYRVVAGKVGPYSGRARITTTVAIYLSVQC